MDSSFEKPFGGSEPVERALIDAAWSQFETLAARHKPSSADVRHPFTIPGYHILGEIHRGGQGVVYQAVQESTQRKVAVKVLKEGPFADSTELARFEREIDVLSRLNHPHVVGIHDRGLCAGHAYYVMDYVPGKPLDAHVASAHMSLKEMLELFAKVSDAVNIAHLRGVIHRDLKPGNIRIDLDGEPRILDFGLAKIIQQTASSSSDSSMTMTGQFIGSLPWASPEQAEARTEPIDLRTDVYSLGVILYQILTGRFPYPVTGRASDVVRHITQSSPARPSTTHRRIDHDLELILLKCLAKEPEQRYQSAGELARDIRHYLADEPVTATSPSAGYRLRKFVRRNRGPVLAGTVVAVALLAATAVSIAFAVRTSRALAAEEKQRNLAQTSAKETEEVAKFQEAQLSRIDAHTMGVRFHTALLEKARTAAERAKLSPERVDAQVDELERLVAGIDFTGMAMESLEHNFFKPALSAIESDFADQPGVKARLLQTLASTLRKMGLYDAADGPQSGALAIRQRLLGDESRDTLASLNKLGLLRQDQGKWAEAEACFREALEKRRRVLGDYDRDTIASINNLGLLLQIQGKLAEAEPHCREALDKYRRVLGNADPNTLNSIQNMGFLLLAKGKRAEAESYYREALERSRDALGEDHPDTIISLNNMGYFLQTMGKHAEAEPYYREALEKNRRVLGDEHHDTLMTMLNMGGALSEQGKLDEAEPHVREAVQLCRRVLGEAHPNTAISINNLGILLKSQGKLAEAEAHHREALEKYRSTSGDNHPDTLKVLGSLAGLLCTQHKYREVVELMGPAEADVRRAFTGSSPVHLGRLLSVLGCARAATGEFEAAEANLSEAHSILSHATGATDRDRTDVLTCMVELYEGWHAAVPDKDCDAKATEWRSRLQERKPTP